MSSGTTKGYLFLRGAHSIGSCTLHEICSDIRLKSKIFGRLDAKRFKSTVCAAKFPKALACVFSKA